MVMLCPRCPASLPVSPALTCLAWTPLVSRFLVLTPASILGDIVTIRHGKPHSKRKSFSISALDRRPDYPGLPEKSVFVGLANKNAASELAAQKAKAKRKEEEAAIKASKVAELIKKARL